VGCQSSATHPRTLHENTTVQEGYEILGHILCALIDMFSANSPRKPCQVRGPLGGHGGKGWQCVAPVLRAAVLAARAAGERGWEHPVDRCSDHPTA
jgi:hypothetical protein